ncbi:hypothetical protein, partial [Paenibacillus thiaminolyticus]
MSIYTIKTWHSERFTSIFSTERRDPPYKKWGGKSYHILLNGLILRDPRDRVGSWWHRCLQEASLAFGGIVASWGLNVWRELLLFYRNFGSISPHPEELLQIYIILGPFTSSRSETGEIPAVL